MKWDDLSKTWRCVVACVVGAGTIATLSIGAENHFAKEAEYQILVAGQSAQQQQIYNMQLSQNYFQFQMQLNNLLAAYQGRPIPPEVQHQINWLRNQLRQLERQMGQ